MQDSELPRASDAPSAELGFALPEPARLSRGRALLFGGVVALAMAGVFVLVLVPRRAERAELERQTAAAAEAPRQLAVAPPKLVSSQRALKLPASVQPLEEAVVYARANGYVARWLVDLGDKVKADQLLLEIETPEVNQELAQARAALAKAQAAKAQKYQEYHARLKELRVAVGLHEYGGIAAALSGHEELLARLQAEAAEAAAKTEAGEADARKLDWELARAEDALRVQEKRLGEARQQIAAQDAAVKSGRDQAAGLADELLRVGKQRGLR